jgi:hypothetical protein
MELVGRLVVCLVLLCPLLNDYDINTNKTHNVHIT